MKTPTKFVPPLTAEQQAELQALMKTSPEQIRCRAQAILLSARRYSVDQIADIYEVDAIRSVSGCAPGKRTAGRDWATSPDAGASHS